MRIVQVDNGLAVGGTLIMTANLSQGLRRLGGHDVAAVVAVDLPVAAPYFKGSAELHHMRLPYTYLHSQTLKRFFRALPASKLVSPAATLLDAALNPLNRLYVRKMTQFLQRWRPDLVHVNSGLEPIIAATSLGIPVIFHLHGLMPRKLDNFARRVFDRVTRFVAISECVRDAFIEAGFPGDKVDVVNNFIVAREGAMPTPAQARRELGLPEDGDLVTLVARIVPWKGIVEFVTAMIGLAKQRAGVRFLLVGDSSESAPDFVSGLHRQIEAAGLTERFRFVPHLADPYLAYRASSVVVHSSIESEPFGMVVIEAMAAGVAVVASPLGGPAEIIEDGVSGLLADPRDSQALTSAVLRLMDDRELHDRIAAAGVRRVQERYSERFAIDSLLRVYQATLDPVPAMVAARPVKGM